MTFYDFHLHWYPRFDPNRFRERLERARAGLARGPRGETEEAPGAAPGLVGVVHDTERISCWDLFRRDFRAAGLLCDEGEDRASVSLSDGSVAVFFRGNQKVSEENLELLVIGREPDYGPLDRMVAEACELGSAVLLPWGFGKWTGNRRQVLEEVLREAPVGLFPSDAAGRPAYGIAGRLSGSVFARHSRLPRLDGSDPLPMEGDETFAFVGGVRGPGPEDSWPPDGIGFAEFLRAKAAEFEPVPGGLGPREAIARQWRLRRKAIPLAPPAGPTVPGESDRSDLESSSDRYARRFGGEVGRCFLERQGSIAMDLAAEVVSVPPGGRPQGKPALLDVGGGHAQIAPVFRREDWEVTILSSDESCRVRPDRILGPDNYRFRVGNLLRLPFPDDSFDVVTAFRLVTHESQWERLLAECCRVARGAVIVDYPDVRGFNALSRLLFHAKKAFEKDTREYAVFRRRLIRRAFEKAGAGEVVFRPQFFLPMVFHRITGSAALLRATEGFFRAVGLTALFGSPVVARARLPARSREDQSARAGEPAPPADDDRGGRIGPSSGEDRPAFARETSSPAR